MSKGNNNTKNKNNNMKPTIQTISEFKEWQPLHMTTAKRQVKTGQKHGKWLIGWMYGCIKNTL